MTFARRDALASLRYQRSWLADHPVLAYALLTYAVTWACWLPYVLSPAGVGLHPIRVPNFTLLFGQYGPTVAALTLVIAAGGRPALRQLLRRYRKWRVHVGWYVFAIFGPLVLLVVTLVGAVGVAPFRTLGPDGPSIMLEYVASALVLKVIVGGALGEEAGWRGFALPRLQARYGALRGTLILGAIWTGWHAPLYLDPGRVAQNPPIPFAIGVLCMAIVLTWVYNRTGGSLLLVILLHSAINSAPPALRDLVPWLSPRDFFNLVIAGYVVAALLTVAATRGRLGYRTESGRGQP